VVGQVLTCPTRALKHLGSIVNLGKIVSPQGRPAGICPLEV